jgi:hypothetical protein
MADEITADAFEAFRRQIGEGLAEIREQVKALERRVARLERMRQVDLEREIRVAQRAVEIWRPRG